MCTREVVKQSTGTDRFLRALQAVYTCFADTLPQPEPGVLARAAPCTPLLRVVRGRRLSDFDRVGFQPGSDAHGGETSALVNDEWMFQPACCCSAWARPPRSPKKGCGGSLDVLFDDPAFHRRRSCWANGWAPYRLVPMLAALLALVIVPSVFFCHVAAVAERRADGGLCTWCRAPAITSLGSAMAHLFFTPGPGRGRDRGRRNVSDRRRLDVSGDDESPTAPRTEGLMMASPFFWAGFTTFEVASTGRRFDVQLDGVILSRRAASRRSCSSS